MITNIRDRWVYPFPEIGGLGDGERGTPGSMGMGAGAISTLGDFSLAQNGEPILAQPNFFTLYKRGQCSPTHELFSDSVVL